MFRRFVSFIALFPVAAFAAAAPGQQSAHSQAPDSFQPLIIRIAAFNLQDVRSSDLDDPEHPRLRALAEVIQRIRPNIILVSEIAWDGAQSPGFQEGDPPGKNGQRFAETFLAVPQAADLAPLRYRSFMAPVNSGMPSGLDLDQNGTVTVHYPEPSPSPGPAPPPEPCEAAREYGNDCWGFGSFPGQYGMALLVDEQLIIEHKQIRTFRLFPWEYMPGALFPESPAGKPWYPDAVQSKLRLSSRSHWDVPVRLPNGATLHILCSHPALPALDGPEQRNARRNHDEIRFWADYVENASYIVDDQNRPGGLPREASFVILGDLNADPLKGESFRNPIASLLCAARRINCAIVPTADFEIPGLDPSDTTTSGLRVDYILPSHDLGIAAAGVYRLPPDRSRPFPSDHFPIWMELLIPPAAPGHPVPAGENP